MGYNQNRKRGWFSFLVGKAIEKIQKKKDETAKQNTKRQYFEIDKMNEMANHLHQKIR